MADEEKVRRCSFCNKSQRDVKKLIAGPTVYICDECVDVCNGILADGGIPAGRGTRAAARAIRHAEDYLRMARDLAASENCLGAARELRNAGLEVLRGLALLEDADATRWPETKVVLNALESNSEIARLLHGEDHAHVLLRVSVEGAVFTAAEIQRTSEVAEAMIGILREKVAEADASRGAP